MKKALFSLLFALVLGVAAQAQIVITEIMYNPPESGVDSLEFIEVLNNSAAPVSMTDWKLEFGSTSFTIPELTVAPGAYQVFSVNANAMLNNFGVAAISWGNFGLSNNGTFVRIKNASAVLVDSLTFDDIAPWPTSPDGLGYSLVLCDPNSDNTLPENWKECPTETQVVIAGVTIYANPGTPSNCITNLVAENDQLTILPGNAVSVPVLANDNVLSPVTSLTITLAPSNGTATVQPDNTILYTPGPGYCGNDAFNYQVCTGPIDCASATVSISIKCYPERDIEDMNNINLIGQADSVGVSCQLTGIVHGPNLRASNNSLQFVMMNAIGTEGITVFRNTGNFGYTVAEGDEVIVRGTIAQFNGLTQINIDTLFKLTAGNPLATPQVVLKASETTENRLVRINNLRYVNVAQWTAGVGSGFSVLMYSPGNPTDTITVRIDNDVTELFTLATPPAEPLDVIGLGAQFDSSLPYNSGYQLLPRYSADMISLSGTRIVNFSSNVAIAPNPVSDVMVIKTDILFDRITVLGSDGAVVRTIAQPSNLERVELMGMPAGVYAVRFEKGSAVWATGVIKL